MLSVRIGRITLALAVSFTSLTDCSSEEIDRISREIRYEKSSILVEDRLSLVETLALPQPELSRIFNHVRKGETNLLGLIRALLKGESLEIQQHEIKFGSRLTGLRILSKVIFKSERAPAKLNWVPSWDGIKLGFPSGTNGGLELLIFESDSKPVLCFPNLGDVQGSKDKVDLSIQAIEWIGGLRDRPIEYSCTIKGGRRSERLFYWCPNGTPSQPLNNALFNRLDQNRMLSWNDIVNLCTSLEVAKPGYYEIRDIENVNEPQKPKIKASLSF